MSYVSSPLRGRDIVCVDVETSGLVAGHHEILEIAAVRLNARCTKTIASIEFRVRMEHPERAHPKALEVNGYTPALWANAPARRAAVVALAELFEGPAGDAPLWLGMNPFFDLGFVHAAFDREEIKRVEPRYALDVGVLAWPLHVGGSLDRIGLDALCTAYGVPNTGAHRAMADVQRTVAVYRALMGFAS